MTQTMDEFDFSTKHFWVYIHGLPLQHMTKKNMLAIANNMFTGLELSENSMCMNEEWEPIMRLKVAVDLGKPLPRGFMNQREDKNQWVLFQYERLPSLCRWCGLFNHNTSGCPNVTSEEQ